MMSVSPGRARSGAAAGTAARMARVAGRSLVPVLLTVVVYQTLDLCFSSSLD